MDRRSTAHPHLVRAKEQQPLYWVSIERDIAVFGAGAIRFPTYRALNLEVIAERVHQTAGQMNELTGFNVGVFAIDIDCCRQCLPASIQ